MIDMCVCDAENKLYENKIIGTNDKVIFITENCAVMQCFDNGFYTYYAVNLNTLKKKYLSKRKNPILKDNYEQLAQKVNNLDINKNDMTLITTRYDRANNLLRHIFSYILPTEGFSFRKNQLDLAVEMLNGLQTKNVALMEAEVGTGKTHVYIIAVIIYNLFNDITKTTLISTSTIALQKAITEEYIPQISDILMKYRIIRKPLDFAVRKGKSHYICDLKLKTYLSSIKKNNSPKDEKLIETLETLSDVDEQKIDLDLYPLTRYVKDRICVTNKCSELCTKYDSCRFIRFTRECMYSGYYFQIANHNYVFADIMSYKPLLPQYKVIVFDEAHKLYDVAKQMYGCYLAEGEFTELIKYITESKADSLKELSDSIENDYPKLFNRISGADKDTANPNERREANIDVFAISYMKSIADTLERITDSVFFCPEIKLFVRKRRIRNMCESIKNNEKKVYYTFICPHRARFLNQCNFLSIPEPTLKDIVMQSIRLQIVQLCDLGSAVDKASKSESVRQKRMELTMSMSDILANIACIKTARIRLTKDYASGLLDDDEYKMAKAEFDSQLAEETNKLETVGKLRDKFDSIISAGKWINEFKRYKGAKKLTQEMVDAFIKQIKVYPDKRIEIEWTYQEKQTEILSQIDGGVKIA